MGKDSTSPKKIDWAAKKQEKKRRKEDKLMKQMKRHREDEEERASKKIKSENNKSTGKDYTVSIAVAGSILNNAQTLLLKTILAGQIGRAAAIFQVDEVVVFDDEDTLMKKGHDNDDDYKTRCCSQLLLFLQYLECPQYLRRSFFPAQVELQHVGVLNPLVTPHHMRKNDDTPYREGVVVERDAESGQGSWVNVGLQEEVQVDRHIKAGVRVTVKIEKKGQKVKGKIVPCCEPRKKEGIYWGYRTRFASSLTEVLQGANMVTEDGSAGYDLVLGTSDKGDNVDSFVLPKFKHLLVVFGGLDGLESALEADQLGGEMDPRKFFHHYINTCPDQGTRTIRTEEAIPITLSSLRPKITLNASQ